jgi:hypothetical protein
MRTVGDRAREKNPLSPCFLETNNKPKDCLKGHFYTQKYLVRKVKMAMDLWGLLEVIVRPSEGRPGSCDRSQRGMAYGLCQAS